MKLAICVPVKDTVHSGFSICLVNLVANLIKNNISYELCYNFGTVIANQRNELAQDAIKKNCTHILWLDSDMHFPASVVKTFLSHDLDIVAATYSTRYKPRRSVAFMDRFDLDKRLDKTVGVHKVFAVGMGCMLIKTDILTTLPKPWFQYIWNNDTQDLCGEDIYFCSQAHDYGYKVYVDASTSNNVAHLGTKAFLIKETDEFV